MAKNVKKQSESVNQVENVQSQDWCSFVGLNKALRGVFTETCKFKQAVRIFDGMGKLQVQVGKTSMTFAELLEKAGVKYANGRIDVESLKKFWQVKTEDGYMGVYRNVSGKMRVEGEKPVPVYTWNADKQEHKTVQVFKKVAVEKWNANLILKGIAQSLFLAQMEKKAEDSQIKWAAVEEVYVFDSIRGKESETNKKHVIAKDRVEF